MSVDELRRGFDRLAGGVVPAADPYGRLMRRSRRRWRVRIAKLGAAVTAAVVSLVAMGVALQGAGGGDSDSGADGFPGWTVTSEWTWRLVNSPTRGDLANDATFIKDVIADQVDANKNLPHLKVLFAGNVGGGPVALVARYSDTHAVLDTWYGQSLTSQRATGAHGNAVLSPVVTANGAAVSPSEAWTLVLAPDGCDVATVDGTHTGTTERRWHTASKEGWLIIDSATPPYLRVTCGGVTRQQGPVAMVREASPAWPNGVVAPEPARDGETPVRLGGEDLAATATATFDRLAAAMLRETGATVAWSGQIPGDATEAVIVAGAGPKRPVLLLIAGIEPQSLVALEPPRVVSGEEDPAENQTGRERWCLVSTGWPGDSDLIAVRLPRRTGAHAELTNRVLATTPAAAVRVEALDTEGNVVARADVHDGAAVLDVGLAAAVTVRAVNANGGTVATTPFVEPAAGARLFNEPIINNW
jgi:hypothetical protein